MLQDEFAAMLIKDMIVGSGLKEAEMIMMWGGACAARLSIDGFSDQLKRAVDHHIRKADFIPARSSRDRLRLPISQSSHRYS